MSFYRVTVVGASPVPVSDLGIILPLGGTILSNQFARDDLFNSADLLALITAGTLTLELDYGGGFQAIPGAQYANLVKGDDVPHDTQSDNANDISFTRKVGSDVQDLMRFDVSANEVQMGSAAVGALPDANVRVKKNLHVDGNITFSGTITDQTVNNLEVENANITLRKNAITDADAYIEVKRPEANDDAEIRWDEAADRWKAGVQSAPKTVALLEVDEKVSGVWSHEGGATDPNMYLKNKASAPTTKLGTADEFPIQMIAGYLAVYDKTNSRNKFLSVSRIHAQFSGRDHDKNTNEYARAGEFTSNNAGIRLMRNATLVGISAQTKGSFTWTVRVRKNGVLTNLASLAVTAAAGAQTNALNIDFDAGDSVEVFIDGTDINRPQIALEFAYRF